MLDVRHEERSSLLPELYRTMGGTDAVGFSISSIRDLEGVTTDNLASDSHQSITDWDAATV